MKEYWEQAERLRRRINRKIHEIHLPCPLPGKIDTKKHTKVE